MKARIGGLFALLVLAGCASAPASAPARAPEGRPAVPARAMNELTTGPIMGTSQPTRVTIPKLHVTSALMRLGRAADGTMQVPPNADVVGWYTGGPTPGALGPAILAGHDDWAGKDGAFAELKLLAPGDEITVNREDGSLAVFAVTKVEQRAKAAFPTGEVYGPINHAGLRLITCGGQFDADSGHYKDNVIVFADLVKAG
jgi:sortase (surface protein transpeptidase)